MLLSCSKNNKKIIALIIDNYINKKGGLKFNLYYDKNLDNNMYIK